MSARPVGRHEYSGRLLPSSGVALGQRRSPEALWQDPRFLGRSDVRSLGRLDPLHVFLIHVGLSGEVGPVAHNFQELVYDLDSAESLDSSRPRKGQQVLPLKAVPALARALEDPEPLVRGHAAWALGEILSRVGIPGDGGFEVAEALFFRLAVEDDPWVEEELDLALRG